MIMIVGAIIDRMASTSEYWRNVLSSFPLRWFTKTKMMSSIKQSFTRDDKQPFDDHYYRLVFVIYRILRWMELWYYGNRLKYGKNQRSENLEIMKIGQGYGNLYSFVGCLYIMVIIEDNINTPRFSLYSWNNQSFNLSSHLCCPGTMKTHKSACPLLLYPLS